MVSPAATLSAEPCLRAQSPPQPHTGERACALSHTHAHTHTHARATHTNARARAHAYTDMNTDLFSGDPRTFGATWVQSWFGHFSLVGLQFSRRS